MVTSQNGFSGFDHNSLNGHHHLEFDRLKTEMDSTVHARTNNEIFENNQIGFSGHSSSQDGNRERSIFTSRTERTDSDDFQKMNHSGLSGDGGKMAGKEKENGWRGVLFVPQNTP